MSMVKTVKLKRGLKLFDIFAIASGAMISSGLFILPGLAHAVAGPAVVVSYLLAGLLAVTGMLSQAELVSAMPKAGGTYFYVVRSMGPAIGTVDGLITWFSLSLKSAFALVGMAAFMAPLVDLNIRFVAVSLCLIFLVINIFGIKGASRVQRWLVVALLAALLFYIARGIPHVKVSNFEPFAPNGWSSIFAMAGFVFVSYGGLLKVASVAEETRAPAKIIPLGMILSISVVTLFYLFVVFVTTGVLGASVLDNSLTPISDGAQSFLGSKGRILMSIAAILAFVSTANAGIMAASRYPLALARDGLLPENLAVINKKFKTPHISILITGFFMIFALFLKLDVLVKTASAVLILTYLFSCFSVIIMRESRLQNYRPKFSAPLYPWVQLIGIIGFIFLLFKMGTETLIITPILMVAAFFVYWFYGRIRATREYALLRLIERITAKEFTSHMLESELKDIVRERDDIVKDRFDHVIEESTVLDIEKELSVDDLFKMVAENIGEKLKLKPSKILKLLEEREAEGSTAIAPGLAIPHIVVDGKQIFDIFLVRSRKGVVFSQNSEKVHAIFVLVGTRDERNFHLRALAAIAQIVQSFGFDKNWEKSRNKDELRDIILLGERKRYIEKKI